jgi:ethanolamine utilization protein EutQ (cupin superfamily)
MKNITIANDEVIRYATLKARMKGETFEKVVEQLLERAMKDEQYRAKRNAQKWQETKELKSTVKEMEEKLRRLQIMQELGAGREDEIEERD